MQKKPLVSIIIPLYNKGSEIARALNSVLSQSFQDFEVIVVDDGSTDNGAVIIRGYTDAKIRLIQQENQGVSAARNKGVKEAKSNLIAFLDADDEWLPDHLETILRLKEKFPNAGLYVTTYYLCSQRGIFTKGKFYAIPPAPWEGILSRYFLTAAKSYNMPISTSSVGISKDIFEEFGGFHIGLNMYEDSELWGKIALKYAIAFSWNGGSIYNLEGENRLCYRKIDCEHPFIKIAEDEIREKKFQQVNRDDLNEYCANLKITFAIWCILLGNTKTARARLINCKTRLLRSRKYKFLLISLLPRIVFLSIWKIKRRINIVLFKMSYERDPFFKM